MFSITGFVIELVLVSHLLRASVDCECCGEQYLLAGCKCFGVVGFCTSFTLAEGFNEV